MGKAKDYYKLTPRQKAIRTILGKILNEGEETLKLRILEVLGGVLTSREKEVVIFLNTIENGRKRTLEKTAKEILRLEKGRKSRERPRQLEARALKRLEGWFRLNDFIPLKELERLEKSEEEKQILEEAFQKCSSTPEIRKRIRKAGITLSDLKTLPIDKLIEKFNIRPETKIEQSLREMWQMVRSRG